MLHVSEESLNGGNHFLHAMKIVLGILNFIMIVLSSGAFISVLRDGGAREEGAENFVRGSTMLEKLPLVWGGVTALLLLALIIMRSGRFPRFNKAFFAVVALSLLSVIWADYQSHSLRVALLLIVSYWLVLYTTHLYGPEYIIRIIVLSIIGVALASLFAIIVIPSYGISVGVHQGKWQGVFDHKNSLGNFLAVGFIFIPASRFSRPIKTLGMILIAILVWESQSGTALASSLIALCLWSAMSMAFRVSSSSLIPRLAFVSAIALSTGALWLSFSTDGNDAEFLGKDTSYSGRIMIWVYVVAKILAQPVLGYGIDQLPAQVYLNGGEFARQVGFVMFSSHNGFLETAYSLGFSGLGLVMACLFMLAGSSRNRQIGSKWRILLLVTSIYLIFLNTFEARLVGFNFYFVVLMYALAIRDNLLAPRHRTILPDIREIREIHPGCVRRTA